MPSIGDVAKRTGLAVSAIRHYVTLGLVAPLRSAAGTRVFRPSDIRRLSFVMIAQDLGFTLPQIRSVLATLPQERTPTKSDWARIAEAFRRDIDKRIARMTRLRSTLDGCIGCGCLSLEACALYNPDDRARSKGPGPRVLLDDPPEEAAG